jgi:hypothetical protein
MLILILILTLTLIFNSGTNYIILDLKQFELIVNKKQIVLLATYSSML